MGNAAKSIAAALAVLAGAARLAAFDLEAQQVRTAAEWTEHWQAGPFWEWKETSRDNGGFWALRPFYADVEDRETALKIRDVLWPLATFREQRGRSWWRALIAYGDDRGEDGWSCNVFPLWFCGRARESGGYWGLFPLWGRHPHLMLMDNWEFALWPLWQTYTVDGVRSRAVLWPFVTWRDAPRSGVGIWPLWGYATHRESVHEYFLWPLATRAEYRADRDTSGAGSSWMFWPVCGAVDREREYQRLFLPPFFSYAATDSARRWRLPWPFIEVERGARRDRTSVWPLWESIEAREYAKKGQTGAVAERTWRIGWKLVEKTTLESANARMERFSLFPFWTSERSTVRGADGERETGSYSRLWPFWSCETRNGASRSRVLELSPIRHSEGLERSWAPWWTFWSCERRPGGPARHSLLWGLIKWESGD